MSTDLIRYDLLVQEALKGVVRRVLTDAAREGLPGEHHFYVSFRTDRPGVRLSPRLRERYPQDMTIVLQHQFDALVVTEQGFEVGLSFSGVPERLRVPFDALTGFFDPSVQFGLKFEAETEAPADAAAEAAPAPVPATVPKLAARKPPAETGDKPAKPVAAKRRKADPAPAADGADASEAPGSAEVVSLDAFRKKS